MMSIYKILFAALVLGSNLVLAQNKVIGYTTSWAGNEDDIDFAKLTHLNYAFVFPNTDGTISEIEDTEKLKRIVAKAHENNVKVYLSVAGWNLGSETKEDGLWELVAENPKTRKVFVKELMNLINNYQMDGVDVYWTYPLSSHSANSYKQIVTDLSKSLVAKNKELSAVVAPVGEIAQNYPTEVFALMDHVNILSYESKDSSSFGYDFAMKSLNYWIMKGLSKEKAIVGIPFHTKYSWDSYENIVSRGASPFDSYHRGESYNGIHQVIAKAELAKNSAGGVMVWEVTHDAKGNHSLLFAIDQIKKGISSVAHLNAVSGNKVNTLNHKEVLIDESIPNLDTIDAANSQPLKKIILKD